jgi:signal transduction histidine kinase
MFVVNDLVTAILLYSQAAVFRSHSLMALAAGYLFTALLAVVHALAFPGAFASTGLLGAELSSASWLVVFPRAGFSLAIIVYAALKPSTTLRFRRASTAIAISVGTVVVISAALSVLALRGSDFLPPLISASHAWIYSNFIPVVVGLIALTIAAMVMVMRVQKSRLDVWLLLSLVAWLMHQLLVISTTGRYTLAWYFAYGLGLCSHVIVTLALTAEASQTYAKLAMSLRDRNQERDARLMSMDAVAAAIAHEVRQPLTAIVTNASAGLRWLDRVPPDFEMARQSLQFSVDQGHRASDLIDSIRSVLSKRANERLTFSLNDLVRETVLMLDQELVRRKVSLALALEEALPLIIADRMQIQQVLVNLLTNAIQAVGDTHGRFRRIVIRSATSDQEVLLEVSDNGVGIAADQMEHIFDFFFTTKASGSGVGLSLCRAVIEEHGGRVWASRGEKHGATFHLQLPCSPW